MYPLIMLHRFREEELRYRDASRALPGMQHDRSGMMLPDSAERVLEDGSEGLDVDGWYQVSVDMHPQCIQRIFVVLGTEHQMLVETLVPQFEHELDTRDSRQVQPDNRHIHAFPRFRSGHGIDEVDLCIMTHDDLDHCSGLLELIGQSDAPGGIRIGRLAMPSVAKDRKGETYLRIERIAEEKGIPITYLHRGMTCVEGKLKLECLHPALEASYEDANEYSAVIMLSYERFSAILTGDLEGQGETDMLDYLGKENLSADVLKVAHHGSKGGTSGRFLGRISSKTALISCGTGNRYGHPAPETVERLLEAGMEILDTREGGQITVTTDGRGTYSIDTFY